ncbi:MAG TPA: DUF742 domain-containing protein [Trebonia sp.]|nr:DUF742 domain-containing protein [Trebonia sp.]
MTSGRTAPAIGEVLDVIDIVVATGEGARGDDPARSTPEHRELLRLCADQLTVADLASRIALPIGVVRVLLADLIEQGAVRLVRQRPAGERPDNNVLQEILNGLRGI